MPNENLQGRLAFLQQAERLKNVLRSAHTSQGRRESTAEHSWRLALMALVFAPDLPGLDLLKLLKLCIIHDLGEALNGDIPATEQSDSFDKSAREKVDLETLTASLPTGQRAEFLALWQEYEDALTPEAKAVKALDKLETIIQHNQGLNPEDFDYGFNLDYGQAHMQADPLFMELRALIDRDTRQRMQDVAGEAES